MKFYNVFVLFFTLFVAQSYAYKVDITLEKAKELKVNTCKSDKDCSKEYETTCYKPDKKKDGHCTSKLFCRTKEKCIYELYHEEKALLINYKNVSTGSSFFFIETRPQVILESCNEKEAKNGNCFTRECTKAEECSSGKCQNSVCVTNEKPLYLCSNDPTSFVGVKEKDFKRDKLTCKLVEQEPCKKGNECMYNACNKIDGNRICAAKPQKSSSFFSKLFKYGLELLGLVCVGTLIFLGIRFFMMKKNRGGKKDLKVKYEMEETFFKNNKDYVELEEIDENDLDQVRKYSNKL